MEDNEFDASSTPAASEEGKAAATSVPSGHGISYLGLGGDYLQRMIHSLSFPALSLDRNYCLTGFNTSQFRMIKSRYGAEIQVGQNLLEHIAVPEDREWIKANVDLVIDKGQSLTHVVTTDKLLTNRSHTISFNPLLSPCDEVLGVFVVTDDSDEPDKPDEAILRDRDLLRVIFEKSIDGINLLDLKTGRYALMNPSQVRLTGFSAEELNNISREEAYDRVYPDDREISVNQQKLVAAGEELGTVEYRWKVKSGEHRWFSDSRSLARDKMGNPRYIVGISRDITELKQMEEALSSQHAEIQRQAQFLDAVLSSFTDYVYAWNRDKQIVYANKALETLWGLTRGQYIGKTNEELGYSPDLCRMIEQGIDRVVRTGRTDSGEAIYAGPAGEINTYEHIFSPVTDSSGRVELIVGVSRNITERKKLEQEQQLALQQLNFHVENTPLALVEFNSEYKITRWSDKAASMFGWSADEVIGKHITELRWVYEEDAERVISLSSAMLAGRQTSNRHENRNYRKDGSVITCEWYNSALVDSDGSMVSVYSLIHDITIQRVAEHVIQESEERFRKFFELGLAGMAIESPTGDWIAVNDHLCTIFGYTRDELMQTHWKDLTHPDDIEKDMLHFAEFQKGQLDYYSTEKRYIRKDKKVITCMISASCNRRIKGEINFIYLIIVDITRQKEYAEEIIRAKEELEKRVRERTSEITQINMRLRSLYQRLIQVQEEERRNLSRELHDEIGQIMTGLSLSLEMARRSSGKSSKDRIQHAQSILRDLMMRTRNISMDLSPVTLNNLRLVPAMKQYFEHYTSQTGIRVSFNYDAALPVMPIDIKTTVYRIVQEALTNIARHAEVKTASVSIRLRRENTGIIDINISDTGKGFDLRSVVSQGMPAGLTGMHERAEYLGGTLLINSAVGKGTVVDVSLPIYSGDMRRS